MKWKYWKSIVHYKNGEPGILCEQTISLNPPCTNAEIYDFYICFNKTEVFVVYKIVWKRWKYKECILSNGCPVGYWGDIVGDLSYFKKNPDATPLFHSDRGFQYTCKQFKAKLEKQKMEQSMSRVGRCIDNGPMEGFWGILKCEMYYLNHFETYEDLVTAVEQFIHYYNHQRRQHKLNCLPPATYRSLLEAA